MKSIMEKVKQQTNQRGTNFLFLIGIFVIFSCNKKPTYEEVSAMIEKASSGLNQEREVNGVKVKIKYLPSNYLAYQEAVKLENLSVKSYDSLLNYYNNTYTFVMSIGPSSDLERGDIMVEGVRDMKEYSERFLNMNFNIENKVNLQDEEEINMPILSHMENIYGLEKSRNILFVFNKNKKSPLDGQLNFIYEDELFGMGTLHFGFDKNELNKISSYNLAVK